MREKGETQTQPSKARPKLPWKPNPNPTRAQIPLSFSPCLQPTSSPKPNPPPPPFLTSWPSFPAWSVTSLPPALAQAAWACSTSAHPHSLRTRGPASPRVPRSAPAPGSARSPAPRRSAMTSHAQLSVSSPPRRALATERRDPCPRCSPAFLIGRARRDPGAPSLNHPAAP
jgi:hypothetical protein